MAFFEKSWPEWELDGIVQLRNSREISGVIPVWLNIGPSEVRKRSPSLADVVAIAGDEVSVVGEKILTVISKDPHAIYLPDADQFRKLASKHQYIPIYRKIQSHSLTPAQAHSALSDSFGSAYLSSVSDAEKKGRYTIICTDPTTHIKGGVDVTEIVDLKTTEKEVLKEEIIGSDQAIPLK